MVCIVGCKYGRGRGGMEGWKGVGGYLIFFDYKLEIFGYVVYSGYGE